MPGFSGLVFFLASFLEIFWRRFTDFSMGPHQPRAILHANLVAFYGDLDNIMPSSPLPALPPLAGRSPTFYCLRDRWAQTLCPERWIPPSSVRPRKLISKSSPQRWTPVRRWLPWPCNRPRGCFGRAEPVPRYENQFVRHEKRPARKRVPMTTMVPETPGIQYSIQYLH